MTNIGVDERVASEFFSEGDLGFIEVTKEILVSFDKKLKTKLMPFFDPFANFVMFIFSVTKFMRLGSLFFWNLTFDTV